MLELKEVKRGSLKIRAVERNSPIGQKLMDEIYKMRFESYTQLSWIPFSKEKSKLVKDDFDDSPNTTHFVIIENGRIIGSHRATKYSPEDKLPCYKDGHTLELFKTTNKSISELTRLVLRQDRRYPGCVLQLAYNMINYTLNNLSEQVCTIGNPEAKDLFEYIGTKQVNDKVECTIDGTGENSLVLEGIPMLGNKSTLNYKLPLDKYPIDRNFVIIKSG